MKGLPKSGWDNSDSSRGFNACVISGNGDQVDNQVGSSRVCGDEVELGGLGVGAMEQGDLSLRQWLDNPERLVDHLECLHIFRQIVETINLAHSQGIVVHNVRPSCFVMSSFNRVSFIESASCSSSSSDSLEDGSQVEGNQCSSSRSPSQRGRVLNDKGSVPDILSADASQRTSGTSCLWSNSAPQTCLSSVEMLEEKKLDDDKKNEAAETNKSFPLKQILLMEISWYTSPEEVEGAPTSFASDIFRLGVLLFELFCMFCSPEEKFRTMSNLRHRVLPPELLLKWPKEASFCLWLLHPQPNTRPKLKPGSYLKDNEGIKRGASHFSPFGYCYGTIHVILDRTMWSELFAQPTCSQNGVNSALSPSSFYQALKLAGLRAPHHVMVPLISIRVLNEVFQSEFLHEPSDYLKQRESEIKLREEIEEGELLLEFLLLMKQRKQEAAGKLRETICFLSSDIKEVTKQQSFIKKKGNLFEKPENQLVDPGRNENSIILDSRKRSRSDLQIHNEVELNEHYCGARKSEAYKDNDESISSKSSRLMSNFKKVESAYFSTRCRLMNPTMELRNRSSQISCSNRGSVAITEGSSVDNLLSKHGHNEGRRSGWINPFLEGLCKYLSYSKLKVRADLKQGDLLNSSNLVCSLSFDRDREFFATAGVNRKIKIFECDMILSENRDIHYPVTEMASRSKLSSVSWNSYIKSQIASSDFDGVVQVWDVTRSQVCMEMREHERRVWSVDFSLADPTKLASGSDDGCVKLWNINQAILFLHLVDVSFKTKRTVVASIGTIKTKANVCCVQFPPDSTRSLAIGSADHKIYYYDLRNTRAPLCTFLGHAKTVSYVKFVDPMTLVSASTDSTLKLWDLSTCTSRIVDSPTQTFTGHTNMKVLSILH
ncbi:hypothetical protein GIB67_026636 [Kingdonia uniflora]|uniref:Uncharacterized protein n=1 Tax=Kingdonia uniflora TaxID=39325 RepID=A0A7J7NI67_9MAGN|nr:hypothetical protein GIB67_026636 [Kingdonia uniflora]